MAKYEGKDHYLDPETGVLKNKLGLTDEEELKEAEASLAAWRSFQLANSPIKGRFDLDHLKAIHKHLFCDVYEWAGELRNIDLAKENSYFANHKHIVSAARPVFEKLADEGYLKGVDAAAFSARAAYYLGEINALHPFREGNGRAQREFINHLAYRNGYFIEWKNITQKEMIQASVESFHHADNTKFAAFIRDNLRELPASDPVKTTPIKKTRNRFEPD
ncbi:Fic/DOC family protein [Desulfobulbus oligotrophicus]|uniref:protein adenylyltransferase n=1 Tax=Desulfobulbus oligotrophicus TaxID=1909699 RepID=A0A7T5VDU7_9BACT|nr:Fic family protein [Desulfobulbus oligotrophicus]QQG66064.1 Fic family protein [Desulfobulbus oligotrophicus]